MKTTTKLITLIATTLTLLLSASLNAKEQTNWYDGIYIGAGLGYVPGGIEQSQLEWSGDFMPNNALLSAFAGYELHRYLDIEAGFSYALVDTEAKSLSTSDYSYYTLALNLKPKYAIKNYENHIVFGVLGLNYFSGLEKYQETGYSSYDFEFKGILYNLGLGYEYKVNKNHSISASYTYNIFGDIDLNNNRYNYGSNTAYDIYNYNQFNIAYKYSFK